MRTLVSILVICFLALFLASHPVFADKNVFIGRLFSKSKTGTLEQIGRRITPPPGAVERVVRMMPKLRGNPAIARGVLAMEEYADKVSPSQRRFLAAAPDPAAVVEYAAHRKGALIKIGADAAEALSGPKLDARALANLPAPARVAYEKLAGNYDGCVGRYMEFLKKASINTVDIADKLLSQITASRIFLAYLAWYIIDPQGAGATVDKIITEGVVPAIKHPLESGMDEAYGVTRELMDKGNELVVDIGGKLFIKWWPLSILCLVICLFIFQPSRRYFKALLASLFNSRTARLERSSQPSYDKSVQSLMPEDTQSRESVRRKPRSPFRPY